MKINRLLNYFSVLVIVIAFVKIALHLNFWVIPVVFFAVGLISAWINQRFSLYMFLFLFPFINSSPALFQNGYPYNVMAPALFLLSGMVTALLFSGFIKTSAAGEVQPEIEPIDKGFSSYYLFLVVMFISAVFVFLRWFNFSYGSVTAIGADTPVSPPVPRLEYGGPVETVKWFEQRLSFASIFPVVSLFLYFISPYIFFYIRKLNPKESEIFKWLSYGFYVSVAIAFFQKLSGQSSVSDRLGKELKQFYGGFSDFNAFGFFSGVMFLWSTYEIRRKNILGYITFAVSLAGGILSGSRTVYFFILAGVFNLIYGALRERKKHQKIVGIALIAAVVLLLILGGGTLTKRLSEGFSENKSLYDRVNAITNGRLWMTQFTMETIGENFESGVGTGNFTFYLAYKKYREAKTSGKAYLYDLTLNHYLLIFAENGMLGFFFFTYFLLFQYLRSHGKKQLLIGMILFSLLFNNFFWFPECFLLFWVLAAINTGPPEETQPKKKKKPVDFFSTKSLRALIIAAVMVLIFSYLNSYSSLHPKTWSQELGYRYDFGFWYPEKDRNHHEFRWTRQHAGLYFTLDKNGESPEIKIQCGAPLDRLEGKKQTVRIFWKGELFKEVNFTENKEVLFNIQDFPGEKGFLEFKVYPPFNLKKMGLDKEQRDLGIKMYLFENR
jgi:hypothetical protein